MVNILIAPVDTQGKEIQHLPELHPDMAYIIRTQIERHNAWLKSTGKNSYKAEEVPGGCEYPHNTWISALEVFEFMRDKPAKYFLYIEDLRNQPGHDGWKIPGIATTWTGQKLGNVHFGREWTSNAGDKRIPIDFYGINGIKYHGTFYKSAGDYARVTAYKKQPKAKIAPVIVSPGPTDQQPATRKEELRNEIASSGDC